MASSGPSAKTRLDHPQGIRMLRQIWSMKTVHMAAGKEQKNKHRHAFAFRHICKIASVTSLCSASSLGCQRDTARISCCASCCGAVAAGHQASAAVDRYLLPARRSAANHLQTDGRTSDRYLDPPLHTTRAKSFTSGITFASDFDAVCACSYRERKCFKL